MTEAKLSPSRNESAQLIENVLSNFPSDKTVRCDMKFDRATWEFIVAALRTSPSETAKQGDYARGREDGFDAGLLKAAQIARDSYPKDSVFDERMKIAAHSIAGTLDRISRSDVASTKLTDNEYSALYYALDKACLMTGAWSNMAWCDLPEHVRQQVRKVMDETSPSSLASSDQPKQPDTDAVSAWAVIRENILSCKSGGEIHHSKVYAIDKVLKP